MSDQNALHEALVAAAAAAAVGGASHADASSGASSSSVGARAPPTRSRGAFAVVGDGGVAHTGDVVVRAELKARAHIMRSCVATQHTPTSRSFVPRVLLGGLARDPT